MHKITTNIVNRNTQFGFFLKKGIKKYIRSYEKTPYLCSQRVQTNQHVLRLPENIPDLIDKIFIADKPYRELLKFKPSETNPRGYPDAYFDGQTWDFKTSTFKNDDTLRHRIKDGRKADNVIFLSDDDETDSKINAIKAAGGREVGSRMSDGSWIELPDIFYLSENKFIAIWNK